MSNIASGKHRTCMRSRLCFPHQKQCKPSPLLMTEGNTPHASSRVRLGLAVASTPCLDIIFALRTCVCHHLDGRYLSIYAGLFSSWDRYSRLLSAALRTCILDQSFQEAATRHSVHPCNGVRHGYSLAEAKE